MCSACKWVLSSHAGRGWLRRRRHLTVAPLHPPALRCGDCELFRQLRMASIGQVGGQAGGRVLAPAEACGWVGSGRPHRPPCSFRLDCQPPVGGCTAGNIPKARGKKLWLPAWRWLSAWCSPSQRPPSRQPSPACTMHQRAVHREGAHHLQAYDVMPGAELLGVAYVQAQVCACR